MKTTTKNKIQSALSFFLGLIFTMAGIEKLTGLPDIIGPHYLIEELAKHDLGLYGSFIAYAQLIVGFLLLTNRFRTLGAMMLLPILGNILVITISLNWQGTPYIVAFLILLNLFILLLDYHKLKFIFSETDSTELNQLKVTRKNKTRDLYYLLPLLIILTGSLFGWSETGKLITKIGFGVALLSLLAFNIAGRFRKVKKAGNEM
ncbi:MAG: hypothetical protein AAFQ94_18815 [Bacteroidota bacterium]